MNKGCLYSDDVGIVGGKGYGLCPLQAYIRATILLALLLL